jgi:hypothetical protein
VSDFNTAGNWDSNVDTTNDKIGPGDTVELCDDDNSGVFRSTFTIQGSGTSGNPITIGCKSGDTCDIRQTDQVTGWVKDFSGDTNNVYRATRPVNYSFGALNEAQTARLDHYEGGLNLPASFADWGDHFFRGRANDGYVYIRDADEDPDDWDNPPEVGARQYGIHIGSYDYITVDGISIYGPEGASTSVSGKSRGGIVGKGSNNSIVDNSYLYYSSGCSIIISEINGTADTDVQDTYITGSWGGIWCSESSGTPSAGFTISRVHITNTAINNGDAGDRDAIGMYYCNDVIVEDSYIYNTSTVGQNDTDSGNTTVGAHIDLANVNGVIVRRNYLKDVGGRGITNGAITGAGSYGIQIYNNVIDGWGQHNEDQSLTNFNAIHIGGTGGETIPNTRVYGNLIINSGVNADTGIEFNNETWTGFANCINNIFYNNTTVNYELYISAQSATSRAFQDNYFYRASGTGNIIYDYGVVRTYGTGLSDWETARSWASNNEWGTSDLNFSNASGTYVITASTPAIIKTGGQSLGSPYDTVLDSNTVWTPFASMNVLTHIQSGTYVIGPFYLSPLPTGFHGMRIE